MGDSDSSTSDDVRDLDYEQARLAYSIIDSLLSHTRVITDLFPVMAQTPVGGVPIGYPSKQSPKPRIGPAYLDSRSAMQSASG